MNSADDAVHSNDSITINGGTFTLLSGDDAIHSEYTLAINGGDIKIDQCVEGIESIAITIKNGNIVIVSSDDAVNAAGNDNGANTLEISGGTIIVYADGDGIDVNGNMVMTGGVVLIHGPTVNDNSALDYDGSNPSASCRSLIQSFFLSRHHSDIVPIFI